MNRFVITHETVEYGAPTGRVLGVYDSDAPSAAAALAEAHGIIRPTETERLVCRRVG